MHDGVDARRWPSAYLFLMRHTRELHARTGQAALASWAYGAALDRQEECLMTAVGGAK